jgi:hypothetical protein
MKTKRAPAARTKAKAKSTTKSKSKARSKAKAASKSRAPGKPAAKAAPRPTAKPGAKPAGSPSNLIDDRIKELGDWRGEMLGKLRALIKSEDPDVVEEWKWMGVPVWEHDGILCTGETYKATVKLTFAKGASLPDPSKLFNSSLEGNMRRAIDFHEGDAVNEGAFKALIRAAIDLNQSKRKS